VPSPIDVVNKDTAMMPIAMPNTDKVEAQPISRFGQAKSLDPPMSWRDPST